MSQGRTTGHITILFLKFASHHFYPYPLKVWGFLQKTIKRIKNDRDKTSNRGKKAIKRLWA